MHSATAGLLALCSLLTIFSCNALRSLEERRSLIGEVGAASATHVSVPCDPDLIGSVYGCYDDYVQAEGNFDFNFDDPEVAFPMDGTPWGIHLTGPYPDGVSYLVSWHSGAPVVGPFPMLPKVNTSTWVATMKVSTTQFTSSVGTTRQGKIVTYIRNYTTPEYYNYSYFSPYIHHVVLKNLMPSTTYYYTVYNGSLYSAEMSFKTLPSSPTFPIRVGLISDIGQTVNSSVTRDHLIASKPDVIFLPGDWSYADDWGPTTFNASLYVPGTNQNKWDTFEYLWQPAFSTIPVVPCAGNHEIETDDISAVINYTTTSFSYPTNYPFQSYSHRHPVPGTMSGFGTINKNMYYTTYIASTIQIIVLNNYIPFYPGTPQYTWATKTFAAVDRTKISWLFVLFHTPPYHTYCNHFKEADCFLSFYEPLFYQYGVDMVFNGHVHAYERSHPVYQYQVDTCGPMYVTIGDGGNVEGPYRNFVDQYDPYVDNTTFCAQLSQGGYNPNEAQAAGVLWGPSFQTQCLPPMCPTLTWQPAYSVKMGMPLVIENGTENSSMPLGFCQSSQPLTSAHRDPSFGHAILEIQSEIVATLTWNRNQDGESVNADTVTVNRLVGCPNKSKRK